MSLIKQYLRYNLLHRSNHFIYFLSSFVIIMFLITIFLIFSLITSDKCDCNKSVTLKSSEYSTSHKLAVLVPYRDRFEELLVFTPYLHDFLKKQNIDHDIIVLNQVDLYRFNRASLINVGYLFTKNTHDYIAMHDVDLLPLNPDLKYTYPSKQPLHIAAPDLHPKYHYPTFVGGILLINREQFLEVNGMSNNYWGWGLEDDEFYVRLKEKKLNVSRPMNIKTNTTNTFKHIHDKNHRKRDMTKCYNQREVTRKRDRLTGLNTIAYRISDIRNLTIDNAPVTILNIHLSCNKVLTPWCDCTVKKTNKPVKVPNTKKKK